MNPTRVLFTVLTVVTATTLLTAIPVTAASPAVDSVVFFPAGNGATYSCSGGPPFVHSGHDASIGNCAFEHVGAPDGLVCDLPTTITFVHDTHQDTEDGRLCH